MFRTLRGRVIATYFIVVVISLVLASVFFIFFLSKYTTSRDKKDLLEQVTAVARDVKGLEGIPPASSSSATAQAQPTRGVVTRIINAEGEILKSKLLIVGADGHVVVESRAKPTFGNLTLQLPANVFSQGPLITEHYFDRLGQTVLFATAPTTVGSQQGYLMAIKPVEQLGAVTGSLIGYVVIAGLISLAISMVIALYLSGALSRPINDVTAAARSMAAGDYSAEVPVRGSDETAELARDFNVMAKRVRTAYEQQRDFVGDVSHELRTPLTSIGGFSQALLDGVSRSAEEQRRSLEIINQESKHMVTVLNDLLLLSELDAGQLEPDMKRVDLVDLMRMIASIYEPRAQADGLALRVEPPPEGSTVMTDADRLERVLTNLLDNAFKYSDDGGTIVVSTTPGEQSLEISVTNSGPGIPAEVLPHVFDRFYRAEKSRAKKHGGAGLGLSICKELVETLGGKIDVVSSPGEGATFTVTLPIS